jgi:hypothetical protein
MYKPNEPQINSQSVLSFVFGVLTAFSLCVGAVPIPFTGFICFPASFLFAILALVFGVVSLPRIRNRNRSSRLMSWTGIMIGGFILLCILCVGLALILLYNFAPNYIPDFIPTIPPFFNQPNYQL